MVSDALDISATPTLLNGAPSQQKLENDISEGMIMANQKLKHSEKDGSAVLFQPNSLRCEMQCTEIKDLQKDHNGDFNSSGMDSHRSLKVLSPLIEPSADRSAHTPALNLAQDAFDEKSTLPPTKPKRQPIRGNWSKYHLLTNSKSKLATINLSNLLSSDLAWSALAPMQQNQLLSLIPKHHIATLQPLIDLNIDSPKPLPNYLRAHLKRSSAFQADIRLFQEDLSAGRYEPQWQLDAAKAMDERARGDFDGWKEANRESFWGEKQKVSWFALAGDSAVHSLGIMVAAGLFKPGDVWRLGRGVGHGRKKVFVEKEATVVAIADDYSLSFNFPPGQHKFSSPANGDDILVEGINGPNPLCNAMLNEDGRIVGVRGANAWRQFRCLRQNQDMGTLWDIRELYHQRNIDC